MATTKSFFYWCFDRWQKLLADSEGRRQKLLLLQEQYRQIEDLYLTFAKKASAFNSWFENAEEDLTDPVRCNSVEEIRVGWSMLWNKTVDAVIMEWLLLPVTIYLCGVHLSEVPFR